MSDPRPTARDLAIEFTDEHGGVSSFDVEALILRDRAASDAREDRLREEWTGCDNALAASQADVTRLTAELAESVRALAVSQAENETTLRQHGDLCGQIEELRGDMERARGWIARLANHLESAAEIIRDDCRGLDEACECALPGVGNPVDCLHPLRAICQCYCHSPVAPAGTGGRR